MAEAANQLRINAETGKRAFREGQKQGQSHDCRAQPNPSRVAATTPFTALANKVVSLLTITSE